MSNYNDIWSQCEKIIHSQVALKKKMQAICDLLGSHMPAYDWVGFYLSDVKNKKLHLGSFYGEPTEGKKVRYIYKSSPRQKLKSIKIKNEEINIFDPSIDLHWEKEK